MRLPALLRLAAALLITGALTRAAETASLIPAEAASDVPINIILAWPAVDGATAYEVSFGSGDKPAFQCRVEKPTFLLDTLSTGKSYTWRVDAVTAAGVKPGEVHHFKTVATADRAAKFAWSIRIANSVRAQYPQPKDLRGWNYTQGMLADALCSIAVRTGRDDDLKYSQEWLDGFVKPDGTIDEKAYPFNLFSLDRVRPGPALLWAYMRTKDEKYLKAAQLLARQLAEQPTTSDGGYWHRQTYPNQMWLDGIYMADVFSVQYGAIANQPAYFDHAVHQVTLIHQHTHDPKTGLYFHGWDETKTRPWANKETGTAPEIWGRAVGWYGVAMADILDWLPLDHPGRKEILPIFRDYCAAVLKVQDRDTAMWWQIMNKPTAPKNYVETSCSIMFAYAFARGAERGWLPPEYLEHARRATRGILNHKVDVKPNDTMDIRGIVEVGTLGGENGFYDNYQSVPVKTNDQKGVGAFMYLSMALSETANDPGKEFTTLPRRTP